MWASIRRRRVLIALSSITVLAILLVALWLAGALLIPLSPVSITQDTIAWEMERPSQYTYINEFVNSSYADNTTSIDSAILVYKYFEHEETTTNPEVESWMCVNATMSQGFVESFLVSFSDGYEHTPLDIGEDLDNIDRVNLAEPDIDDWNWLYASSEDPFIEAKSINQPRNAYLAFPFTWWLRYDSTADQQLDITLSATVFNGTSHQRIEMPTQLFLYDQP